jgi:signal transduction histidine kinase
MKNRLSITKKLFAITTIIFVVFIAGTLIVQSLFFEKFYINKKKSELINNMEKFKISYSKTVSDEEVTQLVDEYEQNYGFKIAILQSNNQLKYLARAGGNRIEPTRLRELNDFIFRWIKSSMNKNENRLGNKTQIVSAENREFTTRSLISMTAITDKGDTIFAISSLQPVNEATSIIEEFYRYFCVVAIIIILLLSLVYSNMIAKPLLSINKTATKMAKLDFSEKCSVRSQDEIGNVAASLNFLSENLDSALTSLKSANAKLEEDIEKERNLEKMRKEFVASVSHELKTPISLIDGYAVGLKDNIFEVEEKDYYLDVIIDEARKMGNLVTDMLDLSQLESGSFKLTKERFNLTDLINFTTKKYSSIFHEKEVQLDIKLNDEVLVYADWNRMEQVITNFITNALKHVNHGGDISINMIEYNDNISIEIENSGSAIPKEDLEKIWDKFYKIDKSHNRKDGGTGIGLSIVKNILTIHGYTFGVKNTNRGVKFYFEVPKKPLVN